jgi:iron complex outermembrane receptor protein
MSVNSTWIIRRMKGRKLDPYYVQDARLIYRVHKRFLKEANIILQVNNIFNEKYEPNGYTYNYIAGGELSVKQFIISRWRAQILCWE